MNKLKKSQPIIHKDWAYFGSVGKWEEVPKPEKLAGHTKCVICRLGVEIEKRPNFYCWGCWKVCIRPHRNEQYGELIEYATARAEKTPGFHGKYFVGEGRPIVIFRAGSEEERNLIFSSVLENLKERGLYPADPQKRWWRRGCDRFNPILGNWKSWEKPTPLSRKTVDRILEILRRGNIEHFCYW